MTTAKVTDPLDLDALERYLLNTAHTLEFAAAVATLVAELRVARAEIERLKQSTVEFIESHEVVDPADVWDSYETLVAEVKRLREGKGFRKLAENTKLKHQLARYEAQLAEKEAEIEHLHKALSLAEMGRQVSVPFARYEAVVEAARELVSPCKHERGFCVAHGTVRLPCSVAELRTALAALDEA